MNAQTKSFDSNLGRIWCRGMGIGNIFDGCFRAIDRFGHTVVLSLGLCIWKICELYKIGGWLFFWSIWIFLFPFSFQLLAAAPPPQPFPLGCNGDDMQVLLDFKKGVNSSVPLNWHSRLHHCKWEGVECGLISSSYVNSAHFVDSLSVNKGNGTMQPQDLDLGKVRVTKLKLQEKGLTGVISTSMGCLDNLKELDLSHNLLYGPLPRELFFLQHIEILDLSFNNLSGAVRVEKGLPSIKSLDISNNFFEGELPNFGTASSLIAFSVHNNSFTGHFPTNICKNSSSVQILDFGMNKFAGSLNEGLADCQALEEFNAGYNRLNGPLPNDLYKISSLRRLYLHFNNFSGNLDGGIENLSNITILELEGNALSGPLPKELGKLAKLEQLILANNNFSGNLPVLPSCKKLQVFNLQNNSFTGNISLDYTKFPELVSLDIATNQLGGSIPPTISSCKLIKTLNLAKNKLSGEIPQALGSLQALRFISLSNNSLINISSALHVLKDCRNLSTLILSKNFQEGEIPTDIKGFPNLSVLALGNCGLQGQVPSWLQECTYLEVLDLSWNSLTGSIPPWLGNFTFLFYLDMSNNSLSGEIPVNLTQLQSLTTLQKLPPEDRSLDIPLYIKHTQNTSGFQYNRLSNFPPALYLTSNNLSGSILPEFGRMKYLHILDLSKNNLTGTIPDTLSNMSNLESLDLSVNCLTGSIPPSFKELTFLAKFNVAYNHLEGQIPDGVQFSTFPASSFEGNLGFCGLPLDACNKHSPPHSPTLLKPAMVSVHNRKPRNTILGISVVVGVQIAFLLPVILWSLTKRQTEMKIHEFQTEAELRMSSRLSQAVGSIPAILFQHHYETNLTIADLLTATSNFDQANIIGFGDSELVYKATLEDGKQFAIKRSTRDILQMEWEFKVKAEALSRAQHQNLVSLQGYCICGDNKLLIYHLLENGSLDSWLHENPEGSEMLDWDRRLRIAQGVGRGLAYLHGISQPCMLHRDIKSTNILLDDKFEAHIADFSLSRSILPYEADESTGFQETVRCFPSECGQAWIATLRGDVYNFGVVILELLTGKRPVDVCKPQGYGDLVSCVHQMKSDGREKEIFDPLLWDGGYEEQMLQLLNLACMCTNQNPVKRPTIHEVVSWIENIVVDSARTD